MGNKDDRQTLIAKVADDFEKLVDFLFRQRRRRLVHDQELGVDRDGFRHFDELLHSHAQAPRQSVRVDVDSDSLENLGSRLPSWRASRSGREAFRFSRRKKMFSVTVAFGTRLSS